MIYYKMYKLANAPTSAPGAGKRFLIGLGLALLPLGFAAAGYRIGKTEDPGERELGRGLLHGLSAGHGAWRLSRALTGKQPISTALLSSIMPSLMLEAGYRWARNDIGPFTGFVTRY
jgi:hypothetical protein